MRRQLVALVACSILSAGASAQVYLGKSTPQEKQICEKVRLWFSGSNLKCFVKGSDLYVAPGVTREDLERVGRDPIEGGDAETARNYIISTFSALPFHREWMNGFTSLTVVGPREDMCRRMTREVGMQVFSSPEHKAFWSKGRTPEEQGDLSVEFLWAKATPVPCPPLP